MDYLDVILDSYGIYDIYTCVGFFIVQIFIDSRKQRNEKLIKRYYRYSVIKIINKADSDINKMKHLYEVFNKKVQNYDKEKSSYEYKYLKDSLDIIGKRIKVYESEGNNINANNDLDYNIEYSSTNINNTNNCINNNKINQSGAINELVNTEEQVQKVEIKTGGKEKEIKEKEELAKYKKNLKNI